MEYCSKGRLCHLLCHEEMETYLEEAEILLKSDAKSLQKFLNGKTDNLKLDRWSLELQGRNKHVEHIPGYKNKAADCLSRLPFVTRKRNDNPLKDEETTIKVIEEENDICCPLCEVDLTDTQTLQNQTNTALGLQNCLKILKVDTMKGTLMGMMIKGFYTMLTEKMGGNTKQQ